MSPGSLLVCAVRSVRGAPLRPVRMDPYSPPCLALQGALLPEWGRPEAAVSRFESLVEGGQGGPKHALAAESVLAYHRDERDRAIRLIGDLARHAALRKRWRRMVEHAVDHGFFAHPYIAADPFMDSVREDAAFQSTLARARTRHDAFRALVSAEGMPR
jgi:hypothetical protein